MMRTGMRALDSLSLSISEGSLLCLLGYVGMQQDTGKLRN
jgi:ABC-type uncharacterized transport system ATPase subunit